MNFEDMSPEELVEAYDKTLADMRRNDTALHEAASELSRLTDAAQKGSMLLVQQAIRWERVAKLLDDIEQQLEANERLLQDLLTINDLYNSTNGGV